jgi:predicted permease
MIRRDSNLPPGVEKQLREMKLRVNSGAAGTGGFRKIFGLALWILLAVAIGILLIASANLASLLTARSAARSAEMALRVSLGAGRLRLVRQLATESVLLSLLAGICGCCVAWVAAPVFAQSLSRDNDPIRLTLTMDSRVLLFCAATCAVSGLFFGLLPAWHATSAQRPILALRHASGQAGKLQLGRFLLGMQVAFAFCLVVTGFGFVFSLRNLFAVNPGFDAKGVWVLTVNNDSRKLQMEVMQQLPRRLRSVPAIDSAAIGWVAIFEGGKRAEPVLVPGKRPTGRDEIYYRVSPGYFATLKTQVRSGRDLELRDTDAGQPVPTVVNGSFARRYFGGEDVLNREFQRTDGTRHVIVGLAADAYYGDLRGGLQPVAYFPLKPGAHFALYVRSGMDPQTLSRLVEREARAITPGIRVMETMSLDALVGSTLFKEKLLAAIGGIFAGLALLLASIGLFGLLSYSVSRRTKEIGIRGALGAKRGQIVVLVGRDLLGMTAGGLLFGAGGSLLVTGVLKSQLYGVGIADPTVLGMSAAVFLIGAISAGGIPALRAASVDPAIALREE